MHRGSDLHWGVPHPTKIIAVHATWPRAPTRQVLLGVLGVSR
uniref:Uncharacterized protein n=1 Tax=Nonomuraea gerenzanensis TaxID=93944 RepID=A0A1M4DYE7_9ACTN|nr:hypothetical protein BN4615_P1105 [Nonomuraea gerenzanensis]